MSIITGSDVSLNQKNYAYKSNYFSKERKSMKSENSQGSLLNRKKSAYISTNRDLLKQILEDDGEKMILDEVNELPNSSAYKTQGTI